MAKRYDFAENTCSCSNEVVVISRSRSYFTAEAYELLRRCIGTDRQYAAGKAQSTEQGIEAVDSGQDGESQPWLLGKRSHRHLDDQAAEREGKLKPGGTIVEATSGNTGIGLAIAASVKGYKCIFVMTDKASVEKSRYLKALGADVVITPVSAKPGTPDHYVSTARRIAAETPNSFYPDQYSHPANPEAHYRTTGPELWEQTEGKITHFVSGIGTGGTISGTGKYLKERNPDIKVIGADPFGSIYKTVKETGKVPETTPYLVEGIGQEVLPGTLICSTSTR